MLSTLRTTCVGAARGRGPRSLAKSLRQRPRLALEGHSLGGVGPSNTWATVGSFHANFCSDAGGGPKKPPKGFERFYRSSGDSSKPEETSSKDTSEASKEASKEDAATEEKQGEQRPPSESQQSSSGPWSAGFRGSAGSQETSKPGSDSKKATEKDKEKEQKDQQNRQTMGFAVAAVAFAFYLYTNQEGPADEITIQQMMRDYLMKGYVDKIQIVNKGYCRVHLRADAPGSDANRVLTIQLGTAEAFEAKIEALQNELGLSPLEHVAIQYVNETDMVSEILPHLPSLLILIPMILAARAMSSGMGGPGGPTGPGGRNIFSIGKAFPSGQKDVKSKTKFNDVAGLEQAKKEVVEFVDFLKNPAKYEKLGARVPKGGLLVGPPGTGKTLLAKAVAGEADCPFYSMSGSDFIEMFVGVGPSRVRDLFQQARASAPSIIFIDEIDAVGRKRGKGGFSGGGNDERENTLNQMLVEMDGFSTGTGVVVLAGTNRVDILDPALTRPGRFDRQIAIDKPDLGERESIFMVHLKPVKLEENLPLGDVAKRMAALTPGFAGADIANICNEAAIFAARRNSTGVSMNDFERATERVMGGLPKSNNLMSPKEKKTVALHESGHAVAGWFLENSDPLLKVSIVPRSNGALGFAQYLPDEISLYSREAILDKIAVSLGGRAAEELFVGRISTGASDDLDKVTKMAYAMVSVYGMNPQIGLLSYNNNSEQQFYKPYSEETGQVIDREARQIVEEQYERVKQLLNEKASLMTALADALSEKETLVYNELLEILGERPFGMKEEYKKFVTAGANPFTAEMPGASDGEGSSDTTADVDDGTSSSSSSTPRTDSATSATPEPEKAPASTP